MKWATRRGVHVDRAACAWLIRRSIDPKAEFVFVDDPSEVPADATAFDIRGAELGHHHGDCSFETILRRYDLDDERYDAPEAPGLDVICRGLSMVHDDAEVVAIAGAVFDGLYEHRRRALLLGREPA